MKRFAPVLGFVGLVFLSCGIVRPPSMPPAALEMRAPARIPWPAGLPVYDHVVIVVEENKDYEQIIDNPAAPYINGTLMAEGANLTRMYGEEHHSQGNYFWLFSGSNQHIGYFDRVPPIPFAARNLGEQLIGSGRSFKGYSEGLPAIGSSVGKSGLYARKHVPWISFSNVPNLTSNLRFEDFPKDYSALPTVSFVIPDLVNDMHNGSIASSIKAGDTWLRNNLDGYYRWARKNNSLLILTFDENNHGPAGLTDPLAPEWERRNRIVTILAGASIQPGSYGEGNGVTHVNLLRTLEAMYGLERSGEQQPFALRAGIADDYILTDVFTPGGAS
ncbi:MAG TPA: alkaline phosphatase family protein [Thermoanaerobaculia bacterium]|nr:alkaline phosphatase family protein [Thermoanaerobaculia bacterium]